jgi:hypothetical protein
MHPVGCVTLLAHLQVWILTEEGRGAAYVDVLRGDVLAVHWGSAGWLDVRETSGVCQGEREGCRE